MSKKIEGEKVQSSVFIFLETHWIFAWRLSENDDDKKNEERLIVFHSLLKIERHSRTMMVLFVSLMCVHLRQIEREGEGGKQCDDTIKMNEMNYACVLSITSIYIFFSSSSSRRENKTK